MSKLFKKVNEANNKLQLEKKLNISLEEENNIIFNGPNLDVLYLDSNLLNETYSSQYRVGGQLYYTSVVNGSKIKKGESELRNAIKRIVSKYIFKLINLNKIVKTSMNIDKRYDALNEMSDNIEKMYSEIYYLIDSGSYENPDKVDIDKIVKDALDKANIDLNYDMKSAHTEIDDYNDQRNKNKERERIIKIERNCIAEMNYCVDKYLRKLDFKNHECDRISKDEYDKKKRESKAKEIIKVVEEFYIELERTSKKYYSDLEVSDLAAHFNKHIECFTNNSIF